MILGVWGGLKRSKAHQIAARRVRRPKVNGKTHNIDHRDVSMLCVLPFTLGLQTRLAAVWCAFDPPPGGNSGHRAMSLKSPVPTRYIEL